MLGDQDLVDRHVLEDDGQHQGAGADHVDPARVHEGQRRPLVVGHREQRARHVVHVGGGDAGVVDPVRVVRRQAERHGRHRGDRAGQADQGARLGQRHGLGGMPDGLLDVGARSGHLLGGRRVVVQVPLGHPHAADVDRARCRHVASAEHQLGRPAADVDDQERRRGVAGRAARGSRRRTTAGPPRRRSRPPARHRAAPARRRRSRRGSRRRATRTWRRSAPARHRSRGSPRHRRRRPRRSAPGRRATAARCGRRPRPAGRSPSAGRPRAAVPARRVESATSSRIELVPQSTAATRVTPRLRRPLGRRIPTAPPLGQGGQRLVAERVRARTFGERVRDEHVQALDPVGHPARGHAGDLGHHLDRLPRGEIALVCRAVGSRQVGVGREPLGHLAHHAAGLERADRAGRLGAGQVVERRERACRPAAAGRSRPRPATPQGQRWATRRTPRGSRPSCSPTARGRRPWRSAGRTRGVGHVSSLPAASTLCHRSVNHGLRSTSARQLAHHAVGGRRLVGTEDDVRRLPRHHVVQPLPRLGLDVGRVVPPGPRLLQLRDPLLLLGDLGAQVRRCRCAATRYSRSG